MNGDNYAIKQADGNFVVYSAGNNALWSSGTNGNPGAYVLLDDTGSLVVYSAAGRGALGQQHRTVGFTPSTVAANAIWPNVVIYAPGQVYADAKEAPGWEYRSVCHVGDGVVVHRKMSKPVCVTAFVAMLDDWTDLANGVMGRDLLPRLKW